MTTFGVCTNLPSQCAKAAAKEPIAMPLPDTTCPECGSRLQPVKPSLDVAKKIGRPLMIGVAALVGIVLLLGIVGVVSGGKDGGGGGSGGGGGDAGDYYLSLSGSNTVGGTLAPELVKAWLADKGAEGIREEEHKVSGKPAPEKIIRARLDGKTIKVIVRAHGSATAFVDLKSGDADIGMASRPVKDAEAESLASFGDMRSISNEHVLGLDGVAIVVPTSNDTPSLSRRDLRRVFSGEIKNWSEVGGPNRPIHLYARNDESGTFDTFKDLVLKDTPLAKAERFEDSAELEEAVANDPDGVGFVGLPYVKTTRAVAISDGSSAALEPTRFSIKTENYPLSRRLFLYTSADPANAAVKDFIAFALSGKGQAIVHQARFVDLDLTQVVSREETAAVRGGCRLSSRWRGDANAYCRLRDGAEQLGTSFRFRVGSAELDTRALQDLRRVLERMEKSPDKTIVLAGFADSSGEYSANCALSLSRSKAIAKALGTLGLQVDDTLGFCSELPVRDNGTPDGRNQNRRVEIFVK
jgi:phosphate transport system substrate-binding protein